MPMKNQKDKEQKQEREKKIDALHQPKQDYY